MGNQVLYRVDRTPYDPFHDHILQTVLSELGNQKWRMVDICALMSRGKRLKYEHTNCCTPKHPEETEQGGGDCKDKALWLISNLDSSGIMYVIGEIEIGEEWKRHAWVLGMRKGEWWIYDCALETSPICLSSRSRSKRYRVIYTYSKYGKFRALGAK